MKNKIYNVGECTIVIDKITFIEEPKKVEGDSVEHITYAFPNFWQRLFKKKGDVIKYDWVEPEGGCRYKFIIGLNGGEFITCIEHKDTIWKWYRDLITILQ